MAEPIFDTTYWDERLAIAVDREQVHHAIFQCDQDEWRRIADKHRRILERVLSPNDAVLDAGCGWGRLLSLMPSWWHGKYLGVDISPTFIKMARSRRPDHEFLVFDLRHGLPKSYTTRFDRFDLAVLISIRPMVIRNAGQEEWDKILHTLRGCAREMLFLEYSEDDEGSIE
jgi:SAM-dependent methyltransferase